MAHAVAVGTLCVLLTRTSGLPTLSLISLVRLSVNSGIRYLEAKETALLMAIGRLLGGCRFIRRPLPPRMIPFPEETPYHLHTVNLPTQMFRSA